MKQKQVKQGKNANQTKPTRKQTLKKVEDEQEEEIVAEEEIVEVKKVVNKKKSKVVVEPVEEVMEVEEDAEVDDQEEAGSDDEDAEDPENIEEEEEEEDDDDGPTEAAIDQEPTIPSKVKSGPIMDSIPNSRIVHVNKLPKKCKQIDIVEVFAKYGPIEQIHIVTSPAATVANVAFKTEEAAKAALAANKTVQVKDSTIEVSMKKVSPKKEKYDVNENRDRCVYVKYLKRGTTEDQIREHFNSCGEIERVKLVIRNSVTFAFVNFTDKAAVASATKLHNSVLNDTTIGVYENSANSSNKPGNRSEKLTIILKNKQNFEKIEGDKLKEIFGSCGEIESMDVLCKKNTLAFITFKTEKAVENAFKLNGETLQDIELVIETYNPEKNKTSIYVSNLHKDATEEDLQTLFSKAGEIAAVILKRGFAIIHFKESDAFCKSFLLNESYVRGQLIFIEPHSMRKRAIMRSKQMKPFKKNNKRPAGAQNGNSIFTPKKVKTN